MPQPDAATSGALPPALKLRWLVDGTAEAAAVSNPLLPVRAVEAAGHRVEVVDLREAGRDPWQALAWDGLDVPASLSKPMADIGLVDVRQEPAEFKMREPRDMRIAGRRPSSP